MFLWMLRYWGLKSEWAIAFASCFSTSNELLILNGISAEIARSVLMGVVLQQPVTLRKVWFSMGLREFNTFLLAFLLRDIPYSKVPLTRDW